MSQKALYVCVTGCGSEKQIHNWSVVGLAIYHKPHHYLYEKYNILSELHFVTQLYNIVNA